MKKMKKFILAIVVAITLSFASSAQASFVSMLNFNGFFYYNDDGGLVPDIVFCETGFGFDCAMTQIDPPALLIGVESAGYRSLGAFAYTLDINLPEEEQELPYWLDVSLWVDGVKEDINGIPYVLGGGEPFSFHFNESFDLGNLTLPPDDTVKAVLPGLFGSIPAAGSIDGFNFQFQGDSESGTFLFGSNDQIAHLYNKKLWLTYSGNATLTGHTIDNNVVPEPATIFLFGSGLLGAFVRRRKRL